MNFGSASSSTFANLRPASRCCQRVVTRGPSAARARGAAPPLEPLRLTQGPRPTLSRSPQVRSPARCRPRYDSPCLALEASRSSLNLLSARLTHAPHPTLALVDENKELRSMLSSMGSFFKADLGSTLPKMGLTAELFEEIINKWVPFAFHAREPAARHPDASALGVPRRAGATRRRPSTPSSSQRSEFRVSLERRRQQFPRRRLVTQSLPAVARAGRRTARKRLIPHHQSASEPQYYRTRISAGSKPRAWARRRKRRHPSSSPLREIEEASDEPSLGPHRRRRHTPQKS